MRLILVAFTVVAALSGLNAQDTDGPPSHQMDDGFSYAVVDYGIGTIKRELREETALWVKLRITNLLQRQLASPGHLSMLGTSAIDDAKNVYGVQQWVVQRVAAGSGRHQPGESSVVLLIIPASELIKEIKTLRVMLGDTKGFGRSFKFFEFMNPQERTKDFDPQEADPEPPPGVEARSTFVSPLPDRR